MSGDTISEILKQILRTNRKHIIDNLDDARVVCEILYQRGILGKRQYQDINSKTIQLDAVALVLDCVEQAGLRGFFTFCHSLHEEYSWLENHLLAVAKKRGITGDILEPVESDLTYKDSNNYVNVLPENILDSSPSEKHLLHVSKSLCEGEWEILALELDLSQADIDHAKNVSTNPVFQAHSMLVTWKRKKAAEATFKALALGLGHCDLQHIILQINEFVSSNN